MLTTIERGAPTRTEHVIAGHEVVVRLRPGRVDGWRTFIDGDGFDYAPQRTADRALGVAREVIRRWHSARSATRETKRGCRVVGCGREPGCSN